VDDQQALFNLDADLSLKVALWAEFGWEIIPWPLISTTFTVAMPARDGQRYFLRVTADNYPKFAPRVLPVDSETGSSQLIAAWPRCRGFRFGSQDLCLPYTRSGYSLHPEWLGHPIWGWNPNTSTIALTLESLAALFLDPDAYQGRDHA